MAIQQTGLGWYADSDWLSNQSGAIGEIQYGGQSGGMAPINTWVPVFLEAGWKTGWLAVDTPSQGMFVIYTPSGNDYLRLDYSLGYNKMRWGESSSPQTLPGYTGGTNTLPTDLGEVNGAHLYRLSSSQNHTRVPLYGDYVFSANTPAEADALALTIAAGGVAATVSFSKSTSGYSVTCMCEWIAENGGDIYCSPVLISTVENNTMFSRDSSATSVPTTAHMYQGVIFYMRKAPLDVLTGSEAIVTDFPVVYLTGAPQTSNTIFSAIALASSLGVGYPPKPSDPYAEGGTSEPESGEGTFEIITENITRPTIPSLSFADTGFTRIFVPTLPQLKSLAEYLWTDGNFIQFIIDHGIKQWLEDPSQAIISLSYLPCSVPHSSDPVDVKILFIDTGVDMYGATTQFVDIDCGYVFINEFYGSALDYNPYTKISLFLPFIGTVELNADEFMNKNLYVKYRIDIVSGGCVAEVSAGDSANDNTCFYQFTGDCAINMPINAADFTGYRAALIGAVETVTLAAAAAGAGVMATRAESFYAEQATIAEAAGETLSAGAYRDVAEKASKRYGDKKASFKDSAKRAAANTVGEVLGSKMGIQHGSGFTGNTGILGVRRPYVIINRPDMCNPEEYGSFNGRPSMIYLSLATVTGYTEVQNIRITGIAATNPELAEIVDLLQNGVIL